MHSNVGTVVRFEVERTLKSSFFWIGALLGPVLIVLFLLATGSAGAAVGGSTAPEATSLSVAYMDDSGLVTPEIADAHHATAVSSREQGLQQVQTGAVDVFIHYPVDPATQVTEVSGANIGLSGYLSYESLGEEIMQEAIEEHINDSTLVGVLKGQMPIQVTLYDGDQVADGLGKMIPLFVFVAAFYLVFFLQGNRMVIAPLEEKQNRVTEMILTSITADALLAGKIIAVAIIGLVQMGVVGVLCALGMFGLNGMGGLGLPSLTFAPAATGVSILVLLTGFLLFASLLVAVGTAVPTEKDAQGLFSGILMVLILPLLLMLVLVLTSPDSIGIDVLTYFPLTAAPIALVRNAIGTLAIWQGVVVSAISLVSAVIVLKLAARLFQFGSIEYSKKIPLRAALHKS